MVELRVEPIDEQLTFGARVHGGIHVGVKHRLGDAFAVAQVDEDHPAEVAPAVHPTHEYDALAGVGCAQLGAGVSAPEVAQKVELCRSFHIG